MFWKEFFLCIGNLQSEAAYAHPENLYLFSIFKNPLFKLRNRTLTWNSYGNQTHQIKLVGDLYKTEGVLNNLAEINLKFGVTMSQPQLDGVHSAILSGIQSLNLNLGRCVWHPEPKQSIVIHIASANKKGCRAFYNTLRAR